MSGRHDTTPLYLTITVWPVLEHRPVSMLVRLLGTAGCRLGRKDFLWASILHCTYLSIQKGITSQLKLRFFCFFFFSFLFSVTSILFRITGIEWLEQVAHLLFYHFGLSQAKKDNLSGHLSFPPGSLCFH